MSDSREYCDELCVRRRVFPNGNCDKLRMKCGCYDLMYDENYPPPDGKKHIRHHYPYVKY